MGLLYSPILFVFLAEFFIGILCSDVVNIEVLEETVDGRCQGFLWSLRFTTSESTRTSYYYALYWPTYVAGSLNLNLEPLEPQIATLCRDRGGIQKLKSKVISLPSGLLMGQISLFRLRNGVHYYVQLYDNETGTPRSAPLLFQPLHRNCRHLNPKRSTNYGYFTSLIRFDRAPYLYWIDQTGDIVHIVNGIYQIGIDANLNKTVTTIGLTTFSLNDKKYFINFQQSYPRKSHGQYFIFDVKGRVILSRERACKLGFHHEAFFDQDGGVYTLAFSPPMRLNKSHPLVAMNPQCQGWFHNAGTVLRYDIVNDSVATVFELNVTYDNVTDSLVDAFRDLDMELASVIVTANGSGCDPAPDSCGFSWGWDIIHPNSFTRAKDGTNRFAYSLRHTSQVLLLDRNFVARQVVGGRGTNRNTYRFPNPADRFAGQHRVSIEADGTLLLFDNGLKGTSRALRLRLNSTSMEARAVWQFNLTKFSGQVARCCGSATVNAAGNILTHDPNPVGFNFFSIYEVDAETDDTPLAMVTIQKANEALDYPNDENVIYRTSSEYEIDGETVICVLEGESVLPVVVVDGTDSLLVHFALGFLVLWLSIFVIRCSYARYRT